ncbi:hypothetical protein OPV22_001206 [Ensete ventricosum]|uniref:Uncharacterized protein n=1 Tax=Ensete ventricosum TaxID=4639 RepID=A0AAV8RW32_ENSVE|nr:hypothetical protein OPV22_001206 [Ensete ventricosum]
MAASNTRGALPPVELRSRLLRRAMEMDEWRGLSPPEGFLDSSPPKWRTIYRGRGRGRGGNGGYGEGVMRSAGGGEIGRARFELMISRSARPS